MEVNVNVNVNVNLNVNVKLSRLPAKAAREGLFGPRTAELDGGLPCGVGVAG